MNTNKPHQTKKLNDFPKGLLILLFWTRISATSVEWIPLTWPAGTASSYVTVRTCCTHADLMLDKRLSFTYFFACFSSDRINTYCIRRFNYCTYFFLPFFFSLIPFSLIPTQLLHASLDIYFQVFLVR